MDGYCDQANEFPGCIKGHLDEVRDFLNLRKDLGPWRLCKLCFALRIRLLAFVTTFYSMVR